MIPAPSTPILAWWWFCLAMAGWYTGIMATVWYSKRDIVAMLYLLVCASLMAVFSVNIIIRMGLSPIDPVIFIAFQRAAYAPMLMALGALIDIYLAEHNGHLSMVRRFLGWANLIGDKQR